MGAAEQNTGPNFSSRRTAPDVGRTRGAARRDSPTLARPCERDQGRADSPSATHRQASANRPECRARRPTTIDARSCRLANRRACRMCRRPGREFRSWISSSSLCGPWPFAGRQASRAIQRPRFSRLQLDQAPASKAADSVDADKRTISSWAIGLGLPRIYAPAHAGAQMRSSCAILPGEPRRAAVAVTRPLPLLTSAVRADSSAATCARTLAALG
jgi:hypothetical protein